MLYEYAAALATIIPVMPFCIALRKNMLEALTFFNIHGMIFDQAVDGSFFNDLQVYVKLLGDLTQELGIMIGE